MQPENKTAVLTAEKITFTTFVPLPPTPLLKPNPYGEKIQLIRVLLVYCLATAANVKKRLSIIY